jgi:peptide/nickel transport system ATP-binding protein
VSEFFDRPAHPYSQKLFRSVPDADKRHLGLDVIPGIVPPLDQPSTAVALPIGAAWSNRAVASSAALAGRRLAGLPVSPDQCGDRGRARRAVRSRPMPQLLTALLTSSDCRYIFPIQKGVLRRVVGHVKAVDGVDIRFLPVAPWHWWASRAAARPQWARRSCGWAPTDGTVMFDGKDLAALDGATLRRLRREFQIIFQDPASSMNPRMLVEDIVAEGMVAQGIGADRAERRRRVEALLQQVGMPTDAADRYPHEFSGGQRQRIAWRVRWRSSRA